MTDDERDAKESGAYWDAHYQSSEAGGLRRDLAALRERLAEETARAERAEARAKALEEALKKLHNCIVWRDDLGHYTLAPNDGWPLTNALNDIRRLLAGEGE